MSRSGRSVLVFGIYLNLFGIGLLIAHNVLLGIIGLPATSEVWIRVVGMLLFLIGLYYDLSARAELTPLFRWSVPVRMSVVFFLTAFVLANLVKPAVILVGVVDFLFALWTALELRRA
jgi:hypothetical protein